MRAFLALLAFLPALAHSSYSVSLSGSDYCSFPSSSGMNYIGGSCGFRATAGFVEAFLTLRSWLCPSVTFTFSTGIPVLLISRIVSPYNTSISISASGYATTGSNSGINFSESNSCQGDNYISCSIPITAGGWGTSTSNLTGNCTIVFDVTNVDCDGADAANPFLCNPYCSATEQGAQDILAQKRAECVSDSGSVFTGSTNWYPSENAYCMSGECNSCNGEILKNWFVNLRKDQCCDQGYEPIDVGNSMDAVCYNIAGGGVGYTNDPQLIPSWATYCSSVLAGAGENYCDRPDVNCDNAVDQAACLCEYHNVGCGDGDSSSSSGDDGGGCEGDDCDDDDRSSASGGDGCEGDDCDDDGNSSASGGGCEGDDCGDDRSSASSGFWCDLHPDDPICDNAGYDDWCDANPNDPFCEYSRRCSQNPHDPECGEPQPPPGGGGNPPGGGGGDGGGSSSDSSSPSDSSGRGVTCEDLSNCDWAKLEVQLIELGVSREIRDSLASLIDWLKYKRHEDSLLASMRWNVENEDRKKLIELSETLNGRIFTYYAEQNELSQQQIKMLNRMDSMSGLYYANSLDGLRSNRLAIDTLRMRLENAIGDGADDVVRAIDRLSGTIAANSGVDLSGVVGGISNVSDGIAGLGEGLSGISDGIGQGNDLLARLDSSLSAGNANIMGFLDTLGGFLSGDCEGGSCGDYSGADSGAFGGLDTASRYGSAGWDSLLAAPGSRGMQDSASAWSNRLRASTATPFTDNVACPADALSVDACGYFGSECRVSLCDNMFYVQGKHFFEWIGMFMEFAAWIFFLVRIA